MARVKTLTFLNPQTEESASYEIDDARVGSEEFSQSESYVVGDYCIYNNTLYKCKSDVAAGSLFDDTDWIATTVVDEMRNKVLMLDNVPVTAGTGDIVSVDDDRITDKHIVMDCVWDDPGNISTDSVTATTSDGSLVLSGTCTEATTVTITLVKKDN